VVMLACALMNGGPRPPASDLGLGQDAAHRVDADAEPRPVTWVIYLCLPLTICDLAKKG
jgi:hypothetical protein